MSALEKKIKIEAVPNTDYAIPVLEAEQVKNIDTYVQGKVNAGIASVIGGASEAMDTLKEVEDYITSTSGDDAAQIITQLSSVGGNIEALQGSVAALEANKADRTDLSGYATQQYVTAAIAAANQGGSSTPVAPSVVSSADVFMINGEEHAEGTVVLASQGTYTLSGKLHGHIVIGDGSLTKYIVTEDQDTIEGKKYYQLEDNEYVLKITGAATSVVLNGTYYEESNYDKTHLIFNNFELISDQEIAIEYNESVKSIEIELLKDTENKVIAKTFGNSTVLSSDAAILSRNSLHISGIGKLIVENNYGSHAIKAQDELAISGKPIIEIDNFEGHDGIHGSNGVTIHNGFITVKNAKDGIGTGDNGSVKIYAGEFTFEDNEESDIESKVAGYIYHEDWCKFLGDRKLTGITVYNGFGTGSVLRGLTEILPINGTYNLQYEANTAYTISGVIEADILAPDETTDIILNGAHIIGNINYTGAKKRISVTAEEGTVNIIDGSIVSSNNIEVKGKGILYITSAEHAIEGSSISIRGDGNKYIKAEGYSVKGTEVLIGDEASDADILVAESTKKADGALYAGKVYARLNSKGDKKGVFVIYNNQRGYVLLEKLQYEPLDGYHGNGINILCNTGLVDIKKAAPIKDIVDTVDEVKEVIKDVNKTVLDGFDFDNILELDPGTYGIKDAINSPFQGENSGKLTVVKNGESSYVHTWSGKKYNAFREFGEFNPLDAEIDALKINGVTVSTAISEDYNAQGVKFTYEQKDTTNFNSGKIMWLYPGATYTLSGVLTNCQIRIGYMPKWIKNGGFNAKEFDKQNDSNGTTTLILDNFYLKYNQDLVFDASDADSYEAAIGEYGPLIMSEIAGKTNRRGKIVIELAEGTKNYLVREMSGTMDTANNKWGVIYSDQDVDIQGKGYLGIADGIDNDHLLGCHAIKAKGLLKIHGQPHIVGRAYHDLLHGNDGLYVDGGYFQALYCNDVLGTDTSLGDQAIGKIRLYNGVFDVRECYGTFAQADDVIVYPDVKLSFKEIGEGLWLQCAPGFYKGEITKKGQISNFGMVDYENHQFRLYTPTLKLDAAAFTSLVKEVSATSVKIMFDGAEQIIEVTREVFNFPGIIVYNGFTVTPDAEYTYVESNRNTHVSTLTNSGTEPDGGWNYNLQFAFTPTATVIPNELTIAQAQALLNGETNLPADANFNAIDYSYTGTVAGGIWNIGVTETGLAEYKNEVDYLLSCIKGMIVTPKTVSVTGVRSATYDIVEGTYTTENVENTREDTMTNTGSSDIETGTVINGKATLGKIKPGASLYSNKTGLEPVITLKVGEAILVEGLLEPADTTNYAMKWSVVGKSEWTVLARLVTDDTMGCYVRGIQPGEEDIIISAKALDKNNQKLMLPVHFVVEAAPTEPLQNTFSINADLIPNPTDSELVTSHDAVSSVICNDGNITITGDLESIVNYQSSQQSQGVHRWLGVEISTGLDSLIGTNYGSYAFAQTDEDEAALVGCQPGSFVIYVKADTIGATPATFTLSREGYADKTVTITFVDEVTVSYNQGTCEHNFDMTKSPTKVVNGTELSFKIEHNAGTAWSEAKCRAAIAAIMINSVDVKEHLTIDSGKNKATYILPGTYVTGDISITAQSVLNFEEPAA